jgi:apolipoprotein N-acyltransferase
MQASTESGPSLSTEPVIRLPREYVYAAALGVPAAVAFPPLGIWPASLLASSLLLCLLRDKDTCDARNLGFVYGLAYGLGTMYWLWNIFGISALVLIGIFAAYQALFGYLVALSRGQAPVLRAGLVAVFAVGLDWLRGDAWYLRFPWYTVPHALAVAPAWIALVRWLGVYGLTWLVWFIAGCGAFVSRWAWAAFLLLPAGSLLLPPFPEPDRRTLLVQAEGPGLTEPLHSQAPAEHFDLVLLPEYAYDIAPEKALARDNGPWTLAWRFSCPVVFGALSGNPKEGNYYNVAAVCDANGELLGIFAKQRPVPLLRDGLPGTSRPVFALDQGTLGVAICYDYDAPEIAASLVGSGATVLLCPTFDAMRWGWVQHAHHELLMRLRAVENDRWLVRTASSGRSEAIDPHGYPSEAGVEIGETGLATVAYGHRHGVTLGGQAQILGPVAAAASGVAWVVLLLLRWRRRKREQCLSTTPDQRPII